MVTFGDERMFRNIPKLRHPTKMLRGIGKQSTAELGSGTLYTAVTLLL